MIFKNFYSFFLSPVSDSCRASSRRAGVRHVAWRWEKEGRAQQVAAREGRRAYRFVAFILS